MFQHINELAAAKQQYNEMESTQREADVQGNYDVVDALVPQMDAVLDQIIALTDTLQKLVPTMTADEKTSSNNALRS